MLLATLLASTLAGSAAYADTSGRSGGIVGTDLDSSIENKVFDGTDMYYYGNGASIYNEIESSVKNTTFQNHTGMYGGAIYNKGVGNISIANSNFLNNKTVNVSSGDKTYYAQGGAIQNAGTMNLSGTSFTNNESKYFGGAVLNTKNLTISNSTFEGNKATYYGGAIFNQGALTINNETYFNNNKATKSSTDARGGAIYNAGAGTLDINGAEFSNNEAGIGGAIFVAGTGSINIDNSKFDSNSSTLYDGGAVIQLDGSSSDISINNSTFTSNKAFYQGGAIVSDRKLDVTGSTFEGNHTTVETNTGEGGGAIFMYDQSLATIKNSTFKENHSGTFGGAISTRGLIKGPGSQTSLSINNSEFTGNYSGKGGAIANAIKDTSISDSTFKNNSATSLGGAIYNHNTGVMTLTGTNKFSGNKANDVANDIYNAGTLTINGTTNLEGGISGNGTVNLGENSVINILGQEVTGSSVIQAATLDVAENASLLLDWGDTINASSITGNALKISDLYVEGTKLTDGAKIDLFTGDGVGSIDTTAIEIFGKDGKFTVALGTGEDAKKLVLTNAGSGGLAAAIDDNQNETLFSFSGDHTENIDTATAVDAGNLNIIGDSSTDNTISLTGSEGISVASGHQLKVENVDITAVGTDVDSVVNAGNTEFKNSSADKINNTGTFAMDFSEDKDINTKVSGNTGTTSIYVEQGQNVNWDTQSGIVQSSLEFEGDGHLELKDGTSDASGAGITADVINKMTGNTLVLSASVTGDWTNDSSDSHAKFSDGASVSGTVTNDGTLDIEAETYSIANGIVDSTATSLAGTLNIGDGTNASTVTLTSGNIKQKTLNIKNNAKLLADASKVTLTDDIANAGTLELTGGASDGYVAFSNNIGGAGKTIISGYVDQTADIASDSTDADAISITGGLKINADNIKAAVTNTGALVLTGGELANAVVGVTGHTDINSTGTVTFSEDVLQAVNVIVGTLENNADITGNVTVGTLNDAGEIATTATVDNNGTITGNVKNDWGSTFNNKTTTSSVSGNVTNAGTFNNKGEITGTAGTHSVGNHGTFNNEGNIGISVKNQGTFNNKSGATITASVENAAPETGSSITQAVLTNDGTISGAGVTNRAGQKVINNNIISGPVNNYGTFDNNKTQGTRGGSGGTDYENGFINQSGATLNNNANGDIFYVVNKNGGTVNNAEGAVIQYLDNGGDVVNEGTITGGIENYTGGHITSNADDITSGSSYFKNDGTVTLTGGTTQRAITNYTTGTTGTVEIKAGTGSVIAGEEISNNHIKLTSGTFDLSQATNDTTGDMDLTGVTSIKGGNGVISFQDGLSGQIDLGKVDATNGTVKVAIDANLEDLDADFLSTSKEDAATDSITISSIKIASDPTSTNPSFEVQIADDTAKAGIDMTTMTITSADGLSDDVGNLLLTYSKDTGKLTGTHSDLENAIISSIGPKAYSMSASSTEQIDNLTLGGNSLSITGNNGNITSTQTDNSNDGITLAGSGQTLSIGNATVGSATNGFKTAIDNTAGGTVNLTNVTMTGNTTDIDNSGASAGIVNLDGVTASNIVNDGEGTKGVFLDGTNNITKIADTGSNADAGQTTVKSGTSTFGSLIQKAVNILSGATVNVASDGLQTTDGTDNAGTLNLSAGTLASEIKDTSATQTGVTNVAGTVDTNGNNIS